jgi:hypothetical protein
MRLNAKEVINMEYSKPVVLAQNNKTGVFAAACASSKNSIPCNKGGACQNKR